MNSNEIILPLKSVNKSSLHNPQPVTLYKPDSKPASATEISYQPIDDDNVQRIFKDVSSHFKIKDDSPIKRELLEKDLSALGKVVQDADFEDFHALCFEKMSSIYLYLGNEGQAVDYMKKAQRRIQKFYFKNITPESENEKRNFSRLKMQIDIDKKFTRLIKKEKDERKEKKRKKTDNTDICSLNNNLNVMILTPEKRHPYLNNASKEIEDSFSAIEKNNRKKKRFSDLLKDSEEKDKDWCDDASVKKLRTECASTIKGCENQEKNLFKKYYTATTEILQKKEIKRQLSVENTFFSSQRTKNKKVKDFASEILKQRYNVNNDESNKQINFNMTGESARVLITAEKVVMAHSLDTQERSRENDQEITASYPTQGNDNPQNKTNDTHEWIMYGDKKVEYKMYKKSMPNHTGNYYLLGLGKYEEISQKLEELIEANDIEKSKALARIMLNLIKEGEPITEEALIKIGINKDLPESIRFLTALCINFYKETFRRSSPKDKKHQIPYAVAQARALILAKEGKIHLVEMFKPVSEEKLPDEYDKKQLFGALYGIPTTVGNEPLAKDSNLEKVHYKLAFINKKYNEFLLEKEKKEPKVNEFFKEKTLATISTCKQIHRDLLEVYGGESDTSNSDEAYLSEVSDEPSNFNYMN